MRSWLIALACMSLATACNEDHEASAPEREAPERAAPEGVQAQQPETQPSQRAQLMDEIHRSVAVLHPTEGNDVRGTVHFEEHGNDVRVVADLSGLSPGRHGFHVHEYGDCSAPDGSSAGGHFNPDDHPHALPPTRPRHAGDMGNVEAGADGHAHFDATFDNFSVAGQKAPVLGRGLIVHAGEDDGEGATGHAGARVSCGVIGVAGPR